MSQYLSLFDAAGHLSSLRDAEFIAMLQLMGRTGAVSVAGPHCIVYIATARGVHLGGRKGQRSLLLCCS